MGGCFRVLFNFYILVTILSQNIELVLGQRKKKTRISDPQEFSFAKSYFKIKDIWIPISRVSNYLVRS